MSSRWIAQEVAVCIPVRNEVALLPNLMQALAAQTGLSNLRITVCFAFDACSDGSENLVAALSPAQPFCVQSMSLQKLDEPNAGRARRAAVGLGQRAMTTAQAALLTTDADSVPANNWVAANLHALECADVVAGRIERDGECVESIQDRLEAYYDALYALRRRIDPVPWEAPQTHHYTSGASLAFRKAAYESVGGFKALAAAEDARVVDQAHRAGLRVRRDCAVRVVTSSRRTGRAVGGLADHLSHLAQSSDAGLQMRVAHPDQMAWQYAGHAKARRSFDATGAGLAGLAAYLERDETTIAAIADASPNAEAFAMRVVPGHPEGERLISLNEAEVALHVLQNEFRTPAP